MLGSVVEVGPAAASSKSSFSSVSRDEEYELATREGTLTFLNFFGGGADQEENLLSFVVSRGGGCKQIKIFLEPHVLEIFFTIQM